MQDREAPSLGLRRHLEDRGTPSSGQEWEAYGRTLPERPVSAECSPCDFPPAIGVATGDEEGQKSGVAHGVLMLATPITWVRLALLRSPRFDGRIMAFVYTEDRLDSGGSISLTLIESRFVKFLEFSRSSWMKVACQMIGALQQCS